jgi:hypothetical protein
MGGAGKVAPAFGSSAHVADTGWTGARPLMHAGWNSHRDASADIRALHDRRFAMLVPSPCLFRYIW